MPADNFYGEKYEDSPLETAVIQDVQYTNVQAEVTGSPGKTQEVQLPLYSCTVFTDAGRTLENVPWMSPYVNSRTGSGVYVIPKVRMKVVIAYLKKGQPVILGFLVPISPSGGYTGNREVMPQGSIALKTDSGSIIQLQDGGVIRLQSTPSCKRTFVPFGDQIRDFCRNYFLITSGGELTFTESTDGQRLTALRIQAFEKGGGKGESVRVQMGSHGEDDPEPDTPEGKIFSMVVGKDTKIYIAKNGRIMIENHHPDDGEANDISISSDGKFTLANAKEIKISSETGAIEIKAGSGGGTKLTMSPDGDVELKSQSLIKISAPQVLIDASTTQTTGRTLLGGGGLPIARVLDPIICMTSDGPKPGYITGGSPSSFSG